MDDVRNPELTKPMADLGAFVQASSDATRRLCENGQSVAKTIGEWNTELTDFLSRRVARNSETVGGMAKCQNFSDIFAIQARWLQEATDDYLKETSKLMEVNSKIMAGLLGSFRQFER